jgi:D-glycero-D-manno-heptose 1,7-bisphosphate phosphatase
MGIHRAVFLDRDGVINRPIVREGKPYPPTSEDALEVLPDVPDALARLRAAGFRLIVVTNQPDIARGTQRRDVVDRMHAKLMAELPIDDVRTCPHDDCDGCNCRKPKAGLLDSAAHDNGLSLPDSFMVGDRWRDVEAGRRAGCTTIFVDRDYAEPKPDDAAVVVRSLGEATDWILSRPRNERR